MVAALVQGKRIAIRDLDDLVSALESSRKSHESLVIIGDHGDRYEVIPALSSDHTIPTQAQIDRAMSAAGGWKGLVDTDELKRNIYSSRGQEPRSGRS